MIFRDFENGEHYIDIIAEIILVIIIASLAYRYFYYYNSANSPRKKWQYHLKQLAQFNQAVIYYYMIIVLEI